MAFTILQYMHVISQFAMPIFLKFVIPIDIANSWSQNDVNLEENDPFQV